MNSKQLIEKTGISRATLNNYIGWGLVPKPDVLPPEPSDGAAPRIGYFPDEVVARIEEIQRLKKAGWSMTRIAEHLAGPQAAPSAAVAPEPDVHAASSLAHARQGLPTLSLDETIHPAYVVNRRFELAWFNAPAAAGVLGIADPSGAAAAAANVFKILLHSPLPDAAAREQLLRFHLGVAMQRGASVTAILEGITEEEKARLVGLHADTPKLETGPVSHVCLASELQGTSPTCVYAVQFREGTLFVHVPAGTSTDLRTLGVESRLVSGDAGRKRFAQQSPAAVLVADLHCPGRIWSELPAEEYFELINQIWLTLEPIFKRHHGTLGKHPGDGIACYFFPHRESSYVWSALAAAHEMRHAMRRISKAWQVRKGWATELYMNAGIDEGQQWLGTLQAAGGLGFTMLGDTFNRAARISDFASFGAIWATKNLVAKLTLRERQHLTYGVHRRTKDRREVFVPGVFSNVENLADPAGGALGEKLKDIARLPITEIIDIAAADERPDRAVDTPST